MAEGAAGGQRSCTTWSCSSPFNCLKPSRKTLILLLWVLVVQGPSSLRGRVKR